MVSVCLTQISKQGLTWANISRQTLTCFLDFSNKEAIVLKSHSLEQHYRD